MGIPHELIDADAAKVVRRLRNAGHTAYLVGGCVRDLLLGRTPKDFDVATSATPQETKDIFRNCRIIGRRFRLCHIFFGSKIIETSTFRSNPRENGPDEDGELLIRRDNVFGTAEEDARRRDFTMNGLFYDLEADSVIDYVGGIEDLVARLVRTIGEPVTRFREDPVRILRAIKFAARLDFGTEPATYAAMLATRTEISKCAPPRVLEEFYRLFRSGAARRSLELMVETGVLAVLFPELATLLGAEAPTQLEAPPPDAPPDAPPAPPPASPRLQRLLALMELCDGLARARPAALSNAVVISVLALPFISDSIDPDAQHVRDAGRAIEDFLAPFLTRLRISRRDSERAKQALLAQRRLAPSRRGKRMRPQAMAQRDYYLDALVVRELAILEALAAGAPTAVPTPPGAPPSPTLPEELEGLRRLHEVGLAQQPSQSSGGYGGYGGGGHQGHGGSGAGGGSGGSGPSGPSDPDAPRRRRRRGGRRRRGPAEGGDRITFAG
ncbi:MAG: polynucleotide adenylyltransferase PcnB [Deltaproteobacteria bacterium]|nr:polynucleotide adenylyltransferase PcnB [Deltaproteobacteria bacterium]